MVTGSVYGPTRPSSSLSSGVLRGNALPLTIPRNPHRDTSGKSEGRPSTDSHRDPSDLEPRSASNRFLSPSRLASDSVSSSHGAEGTSPFSILRRPDRRRQSSSLQGSSRPTDSLFWVRKEGFDGATPASAPQSQGPPLHVRLEGFETRSSTGVSSMTDSGSPRSTTPSPFDALPTQKSGVMPSPSKQPGLLSRTLSGRESGNGEALRVVQEKLEHCLGSRPSIGQEVDGESVSYLRRLQSKFPIFKAQSVGVAFNVASFSYDTPQGRHAMKQAVEAACILAELGADDTAVATALLKDVLSQSMMTEEQLRPLVPKHVADMVVNVGRLDNICQVRQQMLEAANGAIIDPETSQKINHLLMTLADYKGVLVKLADRLAGLQIAVRTKSAAVETLAREALEVFAPIANRLGVWSIKAALEDLAFKVLYPIEHRELHTKLQESQSRGSIEAALDDLSQVLKAKGIANVDLSGRPKNLYGVMRKMQTKNKGLDQVYDVRALRVIVQSKNDCYAVLREVYSKWPEVEGCFKDYIRNPKRNGYRSLHTVVQLPDGRPMEIQIRTDKMHFIAEYGVAAHWRYKESDSTTTSQSEEQQVDWARWLISWSLELKDLKCRPKGSPPSDSAIANLATRICSFPSHNPECKFAAWAARVIPRPITEAQLAESPPMVVCKDHLKNEAMPIISIKELPAKSTVADLTKILGIPDNSHILVNTVEASDGSQMLANGDRLEIFSARQPKKLSREKLEEEREKLQRIYQGAGGSPPTPAKTEALPRRLSGVGVD